MRLTTTLFILLVLVPGVAAVEFVTLDGAPLVPDRAIGHLSTDQYYIIQTSLAREQAITQKTEWITIDLFATPGIDYLSVASDTQLIAYPAGTVRGTVTDDAQNVIADAVIHFGCIGYPVVTDEMQTTRFGTFVATLPQGNCRISALSDNKITNTDVVVLPGEIVEVTLQFAYQSDPGIAIGWLDIIVLLTIISLIVTVVLLRRRHKHAATPESAAKSGLPAHAQAVLRTLNAREKSLVGVLQEKGKLTQTQLQYASGLPKATTSRLVQKLFTQGIVDVQEYGKIKHISLSAWFLKSDNEKQMTESD